MHEEHAPVTVLIDRAALRALTADDAELALELLELFESLQPGRVDELRAAFERGDAREAGRLAHLLAGAFASVAMPKLAGTCRAIEAALANGDLVSAALPIRDLQIHLGIAITESQSLRAMLAVRE